MRAVGYVRVSTEEQAREGYGLAAQEQAIRAYCEAQGCELVKVYSDAGKSGKGLQGRENLARLLDDAAAGRFERVVFVKLDRLARNLRDLLALYDKLDGLGIGVVSISESIDTSTPAGRMIRNVLGSLGEFERETIIQRTRDGMAEVRRQGRHVGRVPAGYKYQDGKLLPDPDAAPKVEELFRRYATGQSSLRQLLPYAHEQLGIRNGPTLASLLRNPVYLGHVVHRGKVVAENAHPAIIEQGVFERVGDELARRRAVPPTRPFGKNRYPLSGLGTCVHCGMPLVAAQAGRGTRYYRCRTVQRMGKAACRQPMVKAEALEGQMLWYVSGMVMPDPIVDKMLAEAQRAWEEHYDAGETAPLRRQLERWRRLFVLGEIDEDRLKRETAPLKARLQELEKPREAFDVEIALDVIRDLGRSLADLSDPAVTRKWLHMVFDRIVVDGSQVVAVTPKPLFAPLFLADRQERFGGVIGLLEPPFGHPCGNSVVGMFL